MTSERSEGKRQRGSQGRAADETSIKERPAMDAWSPATMISAIPDSGGYRHKWVREHVNGSSDPRNVQMHISEGYERVTIENMPEGAYCEEDMKGDGLARWGGLLLMKIPLEFAEQRKAYYQDKAVNARVGVDALQGIAREDAVVENRGSRMLEGAEAGHQLASMSKT